MCANAFSLDRLNVFPCVRPCGRQRRTSPPAAVTFRCDGTVQNDQPVVTERFVREKGVPVFVMLPLDTVRVCFKEGRGVSEVQSQANLELALKKLKAAGVEGVMVDVWWGIVERQGPGEYDFEAYERLFLKLATAGLKVQAIMSFHAAGTNVGDTCTISLPPWVLQVGEANPDIFYTDQHGHRNNECLSTGCLHEPLLHGRTCIGVYTDFIRAFCCQFEYLLGDVITEVTLGMGPAGELRYPSYPEGDRRWRFPGVGEFQCYDKYMLRSLRLAAEAINRPEWGKHGPHNAGSYNSRFWETEFFRDDGSWDSEYGEFFLTWYSSLLIEHADAMLQAAVDVLRSLTLMMVVSIAEDVQGDVTYTFAPRGEQVALGVKLAGVHWCCKSRGHAAELTAGYYNTASRNGYEDIIRLMQRHSAHLSFTCVEMRDCEHPAEGHCSPETLLDTVIKTAAQYGVTVTGENALQRYDKFAFDRIYESAMGASARSGRLEQLTFLRMGDLMFDNWTAFCEFLNRMRTVKLR